MAWLERLAAQQGAPLEELPSITQAPPAPAPAPAPASLPPFTAEVPAPGPVDIGPVAPVTPEVPDWLRSALEEKPPIATPEPEPEAPAPAPSAESIGPGEEDAMTWLERLAARQGAPLEELPSVSGQPSAGPVAQRIPMRGVVRPAPSALPRRDTPTFR